MSIESIAIALHHSRSAGATKLVLIGIANHDGDGGAWPSVATLARYACVTPRHVIRCIRHLEELAEIETVRGGGGGRYDDDYTRPNLYRFVLACPGSCDGTSQHRQTSPLTSRSGGDTQVTPPPDASVTTPLTPVSAKPSVQPSVQPYRRQASGLRARKQHVEALLGIRLPSAVRDLGDPDRVASLLLGAHMRAKKGRPLDPADCRHVVGEFASQAPMARDPWALLENLSRLASIGQLNLSRRGEENLPDWA